MQYNCNIMEKNEKKDWLGLILPFALTAFVIIADQVSKALVVKNIAPFSIGAEFWGGFLRIIHVRNPGVAFSMGAGWSTAWRAIMFRLIPLVVIGLVCVVYFRNNSFTKLQRWCITGIVGGGLGNLIDRFFRKDGVVDFIDVKFFTIPNISPTGRWPTFNIADSAVVVCGILLIISFIIVCIADEKNKKAKKEDNE